ncbi:MAG: very short patch repair endonuclease [Allobaculum sp.]|uniref:very short patch repair endonuclease n=1 Tax=Allobaculum sp. TaxID=1872463 RepID=UPI00399B8FB3
MDIKSSEERSRNMARIRSEDTKPEMFIRKKLFAAGYRYRIHKKGLPGKPDLFLKKYNTAIFIHGCFWHRHKNCKLAYTPKSNMEFWQKKFSANTERDRRQTEELQNMNIRVLIIWECTIRKMMTNSEYSAEVMRQIDEFLHSQTEFYREL